MITYEFAPSASTAVVLLRSKNNSLVEFSINTACQEKKGTIPRFPRIKNGFIPAGACGLQYDVILLCLASSMTPRRRNLLVALAQYTVTHFRPPSWFLSSLLTNDFNVSDAKWA